MVKLKHKTDELVGKTIKSIKRTEDGTVIMIKTTDDEIFNFYSVREIICD